MKNIYLIILAFAAMTAAQTYTMNRLVTGMGPGFFKNAGKRRARPNVAQQKQIAKANAKKMLIQKRLTMFGKGLVWTGASLPVFSIIDAVCNGSYKIEIEDNLKKIKENEEYCKKNKCETLISKDTYERKAALLKNEKELENWTPWGWKSPFRGLKIVAMGVGFTALSIIGSLSPTGI